MDWEMDSTSVVIVGAGFSAAATNGKMPLMTGFFDRLTKEDYPELFDFVTEVGCNHKCKTIAEANIERVLLTLEQARFAPTRAIAGWLDRFADSESEIHKQLSYYTLQRLKEGADIDDDNWAAGVLAGCGAGTTVISMNYDNLAESILSNRDGMRHGDRNPTCPHCRMRLLLDQSCSCYVRNADMGEFWRGAVLKPHGSVAWKRCQEEGCCNYECLVADRQCQPFEPCKCEYCGTDCAPVMVLPTIGKHLDDIPEIGVMWEACRSAVKDAESILLFGFSMPPSDELLMQLIRSACRDGRNLCRIASIDLDPETVIDRFESCLPVDTSVDAFPFPVEIGHRPIWLQQVAPSSSHGRMRVRLSR